ncbi:MAG: adenylate kinase [Deltaproteobacteria bacterium]|nr:adenylate kinase [Deltaproteobacteria bacterium]
MRLIFLGAPGCGKGTQAKLLKKNHDLPQISTGDLLREAVRAGSQLGVEAKGYMDSGALVPDRLVISLLENRIDGADCKKGFILDGFPRTRVQAEALDTALEEKKTPIDTVINFQVDMEQLVERLVGRRVCPQGHGEWHIKFNPPGVEGRCDTCGQELIQREDDQEERIRRRFEAFQKDTEPLIGYYEGQGKLQTVEALGKIEIVSGQIEAVINR